MRSLALLLLLSLAGEMLSAQATLQSDCTELENLCLKDSTCSTSYKTLENCSTNAFTWHTLEPDCHKAVVALQQNPLLHCKCHRHMKREQHCLKIYWTIHSLVTQGYFDLETSPYEDVVIEQARIADYTQLAALVSDSDWAGDGANPCVKVARVCSVDKRCSKHRTDYVSICSSLDAGGSCNRHKCHRYLRQFFQKVPEDFTKRILFCPCQDPSCAERRRKTIVPDCSFEAKSKQNCLQLVDTCHRDNVCRSRLADFQNHCQLMGSSCEQSGTCLQSYMRMIGTAMTPNYMSNTSMEVSLWCSCASSGNKQDECEKIFNMFASNFCLKNAMESQMGMKKVPPFLPPPSQQQDIDASISPGLEKETKEETMQHYSEASSLNSRMFPNTVPAIRCCALVHFTVLLFMRFLQMFLP
ncbi:GDNF family receptor alpha-3 isoform X2 [Rhinatrema bivittatum]|uniref:GDNF family receptor alpha-3 isoform X2 n=1 Tax=Rhinatrema bivittatum TaxID=194408 RepID=UPI0011291A4C|nr:GDNF family receptor alpha-3 isoform X2 [Rhinatrema bivittatum]